MLMLRSHCPNGEVMQIVHRYHRKVGVTAVVRIPQIPLLSNVNVSTEKWLFS